MIKTEQPMTGVCKVRPYTSKDLYRLYGINEKTFRKWIEPFKEQIGEKHGAYFNIRQVETIFRVLGTPGTMVEA